MPRSRRKANELARKILDTGRGVTGADVLEVLMLWRFHQNKARVNVMREGQEWVFSDTLGVVRSRDGRLVLSRPTREHDSFMEILCRWIRDAPPPFLKQNFPFTSRA